MSKFQSIGGVVFFQQVSLQVLPHLTKRAPDVWESARFTSIFLASGFFYISSIVHARPQRTRPVHCDRRGCDRVHGDGVTQEVSEVMSC